MVAILVAAMCALIRENGGFTVLLRAIHKIFRGKKGGQLGVGILVIATANNTVAIVMANPIAKQMSEDYGITPRKTASLLDTFSCISQGILPYGAQMLVAISAVHELGYELSAFEIMANLFYPGMLLVSSLIFCRIGKMSKAMLKKFRIGSTQKIMLKCPPISLFRLIGGHFFAFFCKNCQNCSNIYG